MNYYLLPVVTVVVTVGKLHEIKFSEPQSVDEKTWVLALFLLLNFMTFSKNFPSLGIIHNEALELDGLLLFSLYDFCALISA